MKLALVLCMVTMVAVQPAAAQVVRTAEVWRAFAEKVEVGTSVRVRLQDGRKFTATLIQAQYDALLLQPKTRLPVPVQPVPYESIVSIERVRGGGIGPGKAAAIGVATGVGAFLATLLIFIAAIAD
jgi:hypothetical protein